MQAIITENREKIAELCRQHHVRRLSVFGSAARDDFDPARSDVDFLVEFPERMEVRYAPNFFALQRSLAGLLARDVDLVIAGTIRNPYLLSSMRSDLQELYAA